MLGNFSPAMEELDSVEVKQNRMAQGSIRPRQASIRRWWRLLRQDEDDSVIARAAATFFFNCGSCYILNSNHHRILSPRRPPHPFSYRSRSTSLNDEMRLPNPAPSIDLTGAGQSILIFAVRPNRNWYWPVHWIPTASKQYICYCNPIPILV